MKYLPLIFLLACENAERVLPLPDGEPGPAVAVRVGAALQCSAVMLTRTIALTAAHCAVEDITSLKILQIPLDVFEKHLEVDLAWVHLSKPVNAELAFVSYVPPKVGQSVVAVGFGKPMPGIMQYKQMIVTSVTSTQIFMKPDPDIVCNGDSGSPLYYGNHVVGISTNSNCENSAIATRLDNQSDFITTAFQADNEY